MKQLGIALFIVALLSFSVRAQEKGSWEVVVFVAGENAIFVLTPDGVREKVVLPEDVYGNLALSSDRRYFAFDRSNSSELRPDPSAVFVADLKNGTCCTIVTSPDFPLENATAVAYEVVGFDPADSPQLALLYATAPADQPELSPYNWTNYGFIVIDIEANEVVAQTEPRLGFRQAVRWDADGILWGTRQVVIEGNYAPPFNISSANVWNPTNSQSVDVPYVCVSDAGIDCGRFLELGQEQIVRAYVDMFPDDINNFYYSALFYQDGAADLNWVPSDRLQPIYINYFSDPSSDPLQSILTADWIADGTAVFIKVHGSAEVLDIATILKRDGSTEIVSVPSTHKFLTGTPDGWIAYDRVDSLNLTSPKYFYHYRYIDSSLEVTELAEFRTPSNDPSLWDPQVLQRTPLGTTAEQTPFPSVPLPQVIG